MYADLEGVRKGNSRTRESAEHVEAAAKKLAAAAVDGGMFGRVESAASVAGRLSAVHSGHVSGLKSHHSALGGIGRDVTATANSIQQTDDNAGSYISRSGQD